VNATWIVIVGTAFLVTACGKSPEQKVAGTQSAAIRDVCKKEVAFAVSIHAESQFNGLTSDQALEKCIADRERDYKEMKSPVQGHVTPTTNN
jgi:hypothetical protein